MILVQIWRNIICDDTHDVHEIARKTHDNQTKRVGKLACQRASADCSTSVLRTAKQSAKHHLERGAARKEYNYNFTRYFTLFTISNGVLKTPRDNKKHSAYAGRFLLSLGEQLSLPFRASEVYSVSEVIFDSEVLPNGKVGQT